MRWTELTNIFSTVGSIGCNAAHHERRGTTPVIT